MPELPEVETSRRGIEPWIVERDRRTSSFETAACAGRCSRTWSESAGQTIDSVERRAKYLLINTGNGTAIMHLGMSGSVFIVDRERPPASMITSTSNSIREKRFAFVTRGASAHCTGAGAARTSAAATLGPEPLGDEFDGEYLWSESRGRKVSVKQFIMNAQVVVGVGNIYASESLFLAGINPKRAAGRVARTATTRWPTSSRRF